MVQPPEGRRPYRVGREVGAGEQLVLGALQGEEFGQSVVVQRAQYLVAVEHGHGVSMCGTATHPLSKGVVKKLFTRRCDFSHVPSTRRNSLSYAAAVISGWSPRLVR